MLQGLPCDGNAGRRGGECLSSFPGLICWSGRAVPQRRRTGPPRQTFARRLLYGGTVPLVPPKPVAGRCAAPVQGWKGLSRRGHAAACFLGDTRRLLLAAGAGVLLSCTEFLVMAAGHAPAAGEWRAAPGRCAPGRLRPGHAVLNRVHASGVRTGTF